MYNNTIQTTRLKHDSCSTPNLESYKKHLSREEEDANRLLYGREGVMLTTGAEWGECSRGGDNEGGSRT